MDSSSINRSNPAASAQISRVESPANSPKNRSELGQTPGKLGAREADALNTRLQQEDQKFLLLEQHLPIQILNNAELRKSEWAWKQIVIQTLSSMIGESPDQTSGALERQTLSHVPQPGVSSSEAVVEELWNLLVSTASSQKNEEARVQVNMRTDPPLLPFSSMNEQTIDLGTTASDTEKLKKWVIHDRMVSSVLDGPYERAGGGVFFTPPLNARESTPQNAVKWQAERQTRIGLGGGLIHRLRIECEVNRQPLVCIFTAQRPQLFVHFVSNDQRLLNHLRQGEQIVSKPLQAFGWDLLGWTVGTDAQSDEEGTN